MRSHATTVPGDREPGVLTTFGTPTAGTLTIPQGPSTMDAVTIAERQREGGGAPSQRRTLRERAWWTGPRRGLLELRMAIHALFAWRFRTNHV
jgi:hypothetical protein